VAAQQSADPSVRRTSTRSSVPSAQRQSARRPGHSARTPDLSPVAVASLPGAVKMALPDWIAPQLATLVDGMPAGDQWIHEIKYDGYRIVCQVRDGKARLYTRNQNDWTDKLGPQARAIESLGLTDAWLDGEVVVFTPQGTADFQALQNAFDLRAAQPIVYCLFDLLYLNGYDLRQAPLVERKRLLNSLLDTGAGRPVLRYSDHLVGGGKAAFEEACRQGLEGLMAKRADAPYRSGRTRSWLKIKCEQRQEFVIGGYTDPAGSRHGFGALLVGFYEKDELRYAGKVGTGFTDESLRQLEATLKPLEQARPSFINPPTGYEARGVHWVKPTLVGEVRFAEWTKEGILRQPSFQGLRQDKPPKAIGRERSQHAVERHERKPAPSISGPSADATPRRGAAGSRPKLSHPERVMYPDLGLTKEGLARYYEAVADWILPHLQGRPLTLVRCPQGYQECFYQKHINETVPEAIGRVDIEENGGVGTYMVADTLEAVLGLVQMGVLELHTWGALTDQPDRPDRLTFDLDPDPSVPWPQVIEAAQLVRGLLEELGLQSFVKTTGGKGLHVVTPIQRTQGWEEAKDFSKAVAEHMAALIPQRFTSNMAKRARKGKIFIDYLRNARGATAIAAYSTRAKPGAPVSVPLAWDELSHDLVSDHFTVANTPERLKRLARDPWAGYQNAAIPLTDRMKARLRRAA
jgi:bifunctional non-homologous end joining protein LigD